LSVDDDDCLLSSVSEGVRRSIKLANFVCQ